MFIFRGTYILTAMKELEKIVKILPLGAAILIFLGVLRVSIYYHYFGIDVMSYLSTGEVLTVFLNDAVTLGVFLLAGLFHLNLSTRITEVIEENESLDEFEKMIRKRKWRFFVAFLIGSIIIITLYFFQMIDVSIWSIYLLVFFLVQTITFFFIRKNGKELIGNEGFLLTFTALCVFAIIPLMSLKDIRRIDNNEGRQVVLILQNDSKIKSSEENKFLGKAGEYYFFYQPHEKSSLVLKGEEVVSVLVLGSDEHD